MSLIRTLSPVLLALALVALPALTVAADRDGDGLRDAFENRHGITSADDPDSDGDGVIDASEDHDGDRLSARGEQRFGLDPLDPDSDDDGIRDGRADHDGDGRSNAWEQDQRPLPANLTPTLANAAQDIAEQAPDCGVRTGDDTVNRCHFGDLDSDVTVALVGDSKATMYLPPAITAAEEEGWHLITLLKGRCSPVLGTMPRYQRVYDGGTSCLRWRKAALDWLNAKEPDLIVLVFSDDYSLSDKRDRQIGGQRRVQALTRGLQRTIAAMPAASRVALLADAPKHAVNPVRCLKRNPRDMSACLLPPPPSAAVTDAALQQAVSEAGGTYVTLEDRICPYTPCPLVQGDVLIYRDKGHLTVTFTQRLAPSLRAELAAILLDPESPDGEGADTSAQEAEALTEDVEEEVQP